MNKSGLVWALVAACLLSGCQSTPTYEQEREKKLTGDLVVSAGVRRLFDDDPEVDQLVAGGDNDIKCIRERRVGTHMVKRICRTKGEWDYLKQQTKETHQQNRMAGVCGGGSGPISRGDCGEGRGGL